MKQAATRVEDEEYELFQRTAASIGTTPSDALRIFIHLIILANSPQLPEEDT